MNIRTRISLLFSLIIALMNAGLFLFIFFLSQSYTERDFFDRLEERALTYAQILLEKDELSAGIYQKALRKSRLNLVEEYVHVYDDEFRLRFSTNERTAPHEAEVLHQVVQDSVVELIDDTEQTFGIHYKDNQGAFIVVASAVDYHGQLKLANLRNILAVCYVLCIGLCFIIGMFFSKKILQPVSDIIRQVEAIQAHHLKMRLPEGNGADEIAQLARQFNRMMARLQQHIDAQKNFIHNASHELQTPLTSILGELEVALFKERTAAAYCATLESVYLETERMAAMTRNLLQLSQLESDEFKPNFSEHLLDELVLEALREVKSNHPGAQFQVDFNLSETSDAPSVRVNAMLFKIALANLLDNAFKYGGGKPVKVTVWALGRRAGIHIMDHGIGVPEDDLPHLYEPFYRAGNTHGAQGTGLGLCLVKKIIDLHLGKVELTRNPGKGVTVVVELPTVDSNHILISV